MATNLSGHPAPVVPFGQLLKNIFRQMELYHAVIRLSQDEESLADQLDHAIYKLS